MPLKVVASGGQDLYGNPIVTLSINLTLKEAEELAYSIRKAGAFAVLTMGVCKVKHDEPTPLALACERIADGPQTYEEANTAEGWCEEFTQKAAGGTCQQSPEELQAQLEALDKGCGCC